MQWFGVHGILVPGEVALDQRNGEHQDEEDQRDRRGVAGLLLLEPGADGLVHDGRGGVQRVRPGSSP